MSTRVCSTPRCPNLTTDKTGKCAEHKPKPWTGTAPRLRGRQRTERNQRILRQHRGICHVCGQPGATIVDHITPLAQGGTEDDSNLAPIHETPCHQRKTQHEQQQGRQR